jgi:hypothetical protein
MKLDLNLLSMRFSQAENEPPVPTDGVNEYLLEKILLPCMNGDTILLRDIDYDAFDVEDIETLAEYHDALAHAGYRLGQLTDTVQNLPPESKKARIFC